MAIKQFHFSFALDAKDLLQYVAEKNVKVDIHAYGSGNKPQTPEVAAPAPTLALPSPGSLKSKDLVLIFLVTHNETGATGNELRRVLSENKYSENSLHALIHHLVKDGLVKTRKAGLYRATAKGVRTVEAMAHG